MLLASATLLTGCSIGGKEIVLDINTTNSHTVFSVDNMKCDKTEALIYLANYKNLYGTMYDVNLLETDDASNVEKYIRDVTVDELTRIYCMVSIAKQKKITLTDKEKSSVTKAAKEYHDSLNEAEKKFTKADLSDIESAYEHYAIAQKLYNSLSKGVDTEVSDEDARVIHIQKIFVKSKESADAVSQKLLSKEDFAAVASGSSEDSQTDLYVAKGTLPQEVEAVAFELGDGETSDMISTDDGYYFIRCISKLDREKTEQNKVTILQKRQQEQFNDDYEHFVKKAGFSLNSDLWDSISIKDEKDVKTSSFFTVYDKYFQEDN